MHRIMIVSDTHRKEANLAQELHYEVHIDKLIHLGEIEGKEDFIEAMSSCQTIMVP